MQNMEQKNSEIDVLSDAELETISGGHWLGDLVRAIGRVFAGPGDHRRPLDRP
jgi:bacteriocin-like protein